MLLNCGVGEDSRNSLGLQRDQKQSIIKEISPECSLEGLMLKLKLQYFVYLTPFKYKHISKDCGLLVHNYKMSSSKHIDIKYLLNKGVNEEMIE